ncbi:phosphatase regulator [Saccharomycopsis crataegensis]|uniref:mRNA stability protein n=1 Tax=Saccharomycopsis crataegensis TaxID=43959 RepID=A0AAV5QQP0_9ASCO|nr:phosphatase regulator [Saccharomycopsis crataegensis]
MPNERERSVSPTAPIPRDENSPDLSKLSPQELRIYKLYGKLPSKNDILSKKLKDRKYFDSGDYAMNKVRSQQQQQQQQSEGQQQHHQGGTQQYQNSPPSSSSSSNAVPGASVHGGGRQRSGSIQHHHHIGSLSSSPTKVPDDDFITSSVDSNNYLPLPNVEKIMNLQKKKSITRNGSIISTTNKEITGISLKSNLETEVDSDDIN